MGVSIVVCTLIYHGASTNQKARNSWYVVKLYIDFHWVTQTWRRTLTNGSDVQIRISAISLFRGRLFWCALHWRSCSQLPLQQCKALLLFQVPSARVVHQDLKRLEPLRHECSHLLKSHLVGFCLGRSTVWDVIIILYHFLCNLSLNEPVTNVLICNVVPKERSCWRVAQHCIWGREFSICLG